MLRTAAPPCVRAALLRTWFNGWCAGRRFQQQRRCIFGCMLEDLIEHYAPCPVAHAFAWRRLAIPSVSDSLGAFLLLDRPVATLSADAVLLLAARTAAVYRAHCKARHSEQAGPLTADALHQASLELVRGHAAASALARAFAGERRAPARAPPRRAAAAPPYRR